MAHVQSCFADVDGIRTHYLAAGQGSPVVLLHGGAWGECARTAWMPVIGVLAARHRVIAPDWLGFGETDKIVDFADRAGRMLTHLAALLRRLGIGSADVIGLSMGGAHLLRDQASDRPRLAVRRMVLVSAGGPPITGEARQALAGFDGTLESMRAQIRLAFADPAWAADDEFVRARHREATRPGAYAAFASLFLPVPPAARTDGAEPAREGASAGQAPEPARSDGADPVPYARITVPALVTAGSADRLKPPGYAARVAEAIPRARLAVFDGTGHCPQLEAPGPWTAAVLGFLEEEEPR